MHGLVVLGKTRPEERRTDGRTFVCSAAWHPDHGLIRVYPLAMRGAPSDWSICDVTLERNPRDSRSESWRIAGIRAGEEHNRINNRFRVVGTVPKPDRAALLDGLVTPSISDANSQRRSLALINPSRARIEWTAPDSRDPVDMAQLALFETEIGQGRKFDRIPRLVFADSHGTHHLQLREWGLFELIRHRGIDYAADAAESAVRLGPGSTLLVGNMANRRNVWLVIKVLNLGGAQLPLETEERTVA